MRGSEWLTTAMSNKSNRNHALGSGQWLALVLIATTAIFLGASSIASAESPTQFWNNEYRRNHGWRAPVEKPPTRITVTPLRPADGATTGGAYCVRACDGFYFPLSPQRRSASEAQSLCNALCPATTTEVYSLRGGLDLHR